MSGIDRALHSGLMGLIRRLPRRLDVFCLRAYNRFLRMKGMEHCGVTYFGARMNCNMGDLIQRTILQFGIWEPNVSHVIERILSEGDLFVDVGANVGYHALLASQRVGHKGRVVAIEALPSTYQLLLRNLKLNDASNVRALNVAVSDRLAKIELYEVSRSNIGAVTTLRSRSDVVLATVDACPLSELLASDELARLRLLKIDIEGAEPTVLNNLFDNLAVYSPRMDIIVEASPTDNREAWRLLFERAMNAGFAAYVIENSYEVDWYLKWRMPSQLVRIDVLPERQQDLLLTRGPAP